MDPRENTRGMRPCSDHPEARQDLVGPAPQAIMEGATTWTPAGKTVPVATLRNHFGTASRSSFFSAWVSDIRGAENESNPML